MIEINGIIYAGSSVRTIHGNVFVDGKIIDSNVHTIKVKLPSSINTSATPIAILKINGIIYAGLSVQTIQGNVFVDGRMIEGVNSVEIRLV